MTSGIESLEATFARARARDAKVLVTYAMAGDPDLARSVDVFVALAEGGADIIEVGVPFSDPIADGPVIQHAATRALEAGATLTRVLTEVVPKVRARAPNVPLVVMTYANVIFNLGAETFARLGREAGLAGAIVPDLPLEESSELDHAMTREGLALIRLCAPTTSPERAERIARSAKGFVYCVAVSGVTGERAELAPDVSARLDLLRKVSNVPVVVGFGISTRAQAEALGEHADGIVVGSAIVRAVASDGALGARRVCEELRAGLGS